MQLYTEVSIPDAPFRLDPGASVVSIGSCFAEVISRNLSSNHFTSCFNPFGTLYNPYTISQNICRAISDIPWKHEELYSDNNKYYPMSHTTQFSHHNPETVIKLLNETDLSIRKKLNSASMLIITLGSGWVYRLKTTDQIVGNCHRLPEKLFRRELLHPDSVQKELTGLVQCLKENYPELSTVFTVSPVRHIRDSIIQNSRSKAALLYSIGELCDHFPDLYYFPSFEIVMDELRDYRFYDESMLHPSTTAEKIIWEKFAHTILSEKAQKFIKAYSKVRKGLMHRMNPDSDNTVFAEKLLNRINQLKKQFPEIDFTEECEHFRKYL